MYFTLYSSSDYYEHKSYEELMNLELINEKLIKQELIKQELIYEEYLTKQSCLICLTPPNKDNPIQKIKDLTYIVSICKCNPELHISCLTEWINQTSSCPICRTKIIIQQEQQPNKYKKVFAVFLIFFNFATSIFRVTTLISTINLFFLCFYNFYFIYVFRVEYANIDFY